MGADNYAMCPRCKAGRKRRAEEANAEATAAYGTVSIDEFGALRAVADRLAAHVDNPVKDGRTFREDYEIDGAAEGEVYVSYSGGCSVCGLSLKFDHHHRLDVEGDH